MQVSLLNQENERILHRLGTVSYTHLEQKKGMEPVRRAVERGRKSDDSVRGESALFPSVFPVK